MIIDGIAWQDEIQSLPKNPFVTYLDSISNYDSDISDELLREYTIEELDAVREERR
jgi:hypothetical protein